MDDDGDTRRRAAVSASKDSLNTRRSLTIDGSEYDYFSLEAAEGELGDLL